MSRTPLPPSSQDLPGSSATPQNLAALLRRSQTDFEVEFYGQILQRSPAYPEVLTQLGQLYTLKNWHPQALEIDLRHAQVRPTNPVVLYNLACSYALCEQSEEAIQQLKKAIECGYSDVDHMASDPDLESLYDHPDFIQLLSDLSDRESASELY